jgi:hypothetical protein
MQKSGQIYVAGIELETWHRLSTITTLLSYAKEAYYMHLLTGEAARRGGWAIEPKDMI